MAVSDTGVADLASLQTYATTFSESLSSQEKDLFDASKVASALLDEITDVDTQHSKTSGLRSWSQKLGPFIAAIEQYGKCIDVFANASDLLCPIWGSIRVVLHLAKEFSEYFTKITDMLESIGVILSNIPRYAQLYPNNTKLQEYMVGIYQAIFDFCLKARHVFHIGKVRSCAIKSFKAAVSVSAAIRLAWKPFDSQFGEVKQRLEKLVAAVTVEADLAERELVRSDQQKSQGRWDTVIATNERLNVVLDNDSIQQVNRLLAPVNVAVSHKAISSLRYADTGTWFLNTDVFRTWLDEDNSFLWLHAIPGAGKTVLVSTIINYLRANVQNQQVGLAYFYCDYKEAQKQEPSRILATIIAELAKQRRQIFRNVEAFLQENYQDLAVGAADFDLLLSNFQGFIGDNFQSIILVIDGLDEISPSGWTCITDALLTLRQKCQMLKIIVSSRNELPIARAFEDLPSYHIMEADVAADIKSYIVGEVTESVKRRKLKLRDPELQSLIQDTLSRDANGMFQWVTCQINALCKLRNDKAIRAALMNLPRTLQATYLRILDRIEQDFPDDVHIVRRILCWLVRGARAMTLSELAEAISIEVGGDETSMDFDAVDNDPQDILEVLSGLVTVSTDTYISLSHLSVKDFLVSDDVKQKKPGFWVGQADVESKLASVCLKYLCYDDFEPANQDEDDAEPEEREEDTDTYAFLPYSAYSWAIHAARSESLGPPIDEVVDLTMQFFHLEANYDSWLRACRRHKLHAKLVRKKPSPLLLAANFGLTASAKLLLEDGAQETDEILCCVRAAACAGHAGIMALLLNYSVSDDQGVGENPKIVPLPKLNEALYFAAARGHDSVVGTALDFGADINSIAGKEGTALQVAALEGRYTTVKQLLDRGASHGIRSKRYGTPLAAAAEKGHERTVAVLMTHGADPNGRGGWHSLPLVSAIVGKNTAVITNLINNGANVNARGGRLGCPLMAAASFGMNDLIKELIDEGAHVNDEDDRSSDALYSAALAGHSSTIKTLLDLGADVNALGGKYKNALGAASWEGHADVVRMLLDSGADTGFFDTDKGNALHFAAARGHLEITKMLVEAGMNPLVESSNKGASLCSAAISGHLAVVEYLWGLDLDLANDGDGEDVKTLVAAAANNHEDIVRFVAGRIPDKLDWYTEAEEHDTPEACTALEAAASKGYLGVVNILLDAGDESFRTEYDGWYGTTLISSIDTDHSSIDVVRRLLDAGADPNQAAESESHCFGLPLARAAYRNNKQVVGLLLERGAELNETFENSPTAIQMAAMHPDAELLELLIKHGADINLVPEVQDLYDEIEEDDGLKDGPISALQTAIWYGHEHIVQKLLDLGAETSTKVEDVVFQSALQVAAYQNHLSIMTMLLERGVDVNEQGGYLGTALQAAASQGHEPAIRLLLEAGADATDHSCGWYATPLRAISGDSLTPKQTRVMDLLIDYGLDVNMRLKSVHTDYVYLLHHAVYQQGDDDDFKFAEYLLDKGADINARGGKGGTALQIAAKEGNVNTVKFLLERGADPNLTGGMYHTPLQAAYRHGYYLVLNSLYAHGAVNTLVGGHTGSPMGVGLGCYDADDVDEDDDDDEGYSGCCQTLIHQLLMYRDFDVNTQYGRWGNALQNYIMADRDDVELDYFLDAGAEVNRLGGAMGTALCAAAYMGNIDALNELMEREADVGLGNHTYPNPAFGAIKGGRGEALDILIAGGADVKSAIGPGGSALQLAAAEAGGSLGIVRAVLRAGAAVNAPSAGKYGSALCAAAAMGDELTVRFLVNRGADVLTRGGVYGNALQAACTRPGTNIAELLLRKGARVDEHGGRFGSPLQAAAVAGCTQKALLLLRHGADINFQGGRYGTALQAACVSGELMLVKMLVERGARLDLKGGFYETPLLAASILDYEDIVKYLLEERDDWEPLKRKSNIAPEDFEYAEEMIRTTKAELDDPSDNEDSEWEDESDDDDATDTEDDEATESEVEFLPMNVEAIPGSIEPRLSNWTAVREMSLHGIRQQVVRVESLEIERLDDGSGGSRSCGGTLAKDGGTTMDAVVGNREAQAKTGSNVVTITSVSESDNELWHDLTTLEADDIS